jgi:hypothetical protein
MPLVVIDNFHRFGIAATPHKKDAPLVNDPDTVLSLSCAFESRKSIGRRHAQVFSCCALFNIRSFPRVTTWISAGNFREIVLSRINTSCQG